MQYFSNDQLLELIQRLHRLTVEKKLKWQAEPGSDDYAFAVGVKDTVFSIQSRDQDDFAPHVFGIFHRDDESGGLKKVQEIDTQDADINMAEACENLYQLVKRQTLNIDTVATEIFGALDELE